MGQPPPGISGAGPLVGPPESNRFLSGRGLGDAEALPDAEALLVGEGLEVVEVEGVGLLEVVVAAGLLSCAMAGAVGPENCAHVVRATTPATSTNTSKAATFSALLPILANIVLHYLR